MILSKIIIGTHLQIPEDGKKAVDVFEANEEINSDLLNTSEIVIQSTTDEITNEIKEI